MTAQLTRYQAHARHLTGVTIGLLPQLRAMRERVSLEDRMALERIIEAAERAATTSSGRAGA